MKTHNEFSAQETMEDYRQERRKCHEENAKKHHKKSAYPEQGQPQGRRTHQGVPRLNVLQGRVVSAAVARWREVNQTPLATIFHYSL